MTLRSIGPRRLDDDLDEKCLIYRWTCPVCNKSNVGFVAARDSAAEAVEMLRSHVLAVDGYQHGPENQIPAEWTTDRLASHVAVIDTFES